MKRTSRRLADPSGFSLPDVLMTIAVMAILAAMAVPQAKDMVDGMRLGIATRDVERELQFARLKAVSTTRQMRVRFDCPQTGQLRVVELIGTPIAPAAGDLASNRCSESAYPYKPTGGDASRLTRPNNDGPVRYLERGVRFTASQTLEFWPNGTVHAVNTDGTSVTTDVGSAGVTITVTKGTGTGAKSKNIVVNGLGKIQMDR